MRFHLAFPAILAVAFVPLSTSTAAAEITGGEIALSYSAFTDASDVNRSSIEGAVEYSFGRNFSVQGDIALHNFGATNQDLSTVSVHGIYHLDDATSVGAFLSNDHASGENSTIYGIEVGRDLGRFDVEGYLGGFDDSGLKGTLIGGQARYAYTSQIGFGANFDYGSFDGNLDLTRFGVNADYKFDGGPVVSAEIGQLNANAFGLGGNEAYVKVGIGFEFGAKRGATFGNRSLTRLLPGL